MQMLRFTLLRGASAGALALGLASSVAFAQEVLPTIEIGKRTPTATPRGSGPPSPGGVAAGPVEPGGPRSADQNGSLTVPSVAELRKQVFQTVGSVDFVNSNTPAIQTRHIADLTDALKDVPGVFAETRYGQEIRLSVRGSNITRDYHLRGLELLQDGIPVNYPDGGGDFYQIDPHYFRAIEVLKGGNALSFGASTLGGAINFISPTAYTALSPNLLAADGGSYNAIRGQAQVSRIIGDFDFLINASFPHGGGFREHSKSNYTLLNANFGYRFSAAAETRFYLGIYDTRQQLPGTLNIYEALTNPQRSNPPFIPGVNMNGFGADQARNVTNQRIANKTTFETEIGRLDVSSWFIHNKLFHPIFVVIDQDGYTWGFTPRLTSKFNIGDHRNELITGVRIWGGRTTDKWFTNYNGQELNPPSPIGGFAPITPPLSDPRIRDNRAEALNLEAYFENRFHIVPELIFMFGAKIFSDARKYAVLGDIVADPIPSYQDKNYRGINPKVGLMFEPAPNIQFFADMTGSRDVPDFIDLTQGFFPARPGPQFTRLSAQKAWTGEIGARGAWDRFTWNVTYYYSSLSDELLKFSTNPAIGLPPITFNAPHTVHQGVEFAASTELLRDIFGPGAGDILKLSQVWTWNDFRFDNDPTFGGNPLPGIPRHILRTTLAYSRPDGLYIAPSVDWVPQGAWTDYRHTQQTPGYALFGIQAGYELPQYGLSFYVDARNINSARYISDVTTVVDARDPGTKATFYPGTGRAVYAGMKLRF
jgi:iron complex outermembrane receptor protein